MALQKLFQPTKVVQKGYRLWFLVIGFKMKSPRVFRCIMFVTGLLSLASMVFASPGAVYAGTRCLRSGEAIRAIAWRPDGEVLAVATDEELWLCDIHGDPLNRLPVVSGQKMRRLAWSPDGGKLAASTYATDSIVHVYVWDLNTLSVDVTLGDTQSQVSEIAWSADGQRLATTWLNEIRIWDVSAGESLTTLKGHELPYSIKSLAWSNDGKRLAGGSNDHTVRIWDTSTYQILAVLQLTESVDWVVWSPDDTQLAAVDYAHIAIWDSTNYQRISTLTGHTAAIVRLDWKAETLASADVDHVIRIWDTNTWQTVSTIPNDEKVFTISLSPDGDRLAYGGSSGILKIIEVVPPQVFQLRPKTKNLSPITNQKGHMHLWKHSSRNSPKPGGRPALSISSAT